MALKTDRFGNEIDETVGYARGKILGSSVGERKRLLQGQRTATKRLKELGPESIGIFTGNLRAFPVDFEQADVTCEEWLGLGLIDADFQEAAIKHLEGVRGKHVATLLNRTSGGLIAAVCALAADRSVVSGVPFGSKSHPSIARGCFAARVELRESDSVQSFSGQVQAYAPKLAIITTVSSNLDRVPEADIAEMIRVAKSLGAVTLIDDAYGARIRPILYAGTPALQLGADLVITNCDKAGMIGPRAGLLAGGDALVQKVAAKVAEFGMEARAPIVAAVTESLRMFEDKWLREEVDLGGRLSTLFEARFGHEYVHRSDLGPIIYEDDLLEIVAKRARRAAGELPLVPVEIASALGMILLRDHGILTTNTHGQPGSKASLRLRPTPSGIARIGGLAALVTATESATTTLAGMIHDSAGVSQLIIGE